MYQNPIYNPVKHKKLIKLKSSCIPSSDFYHHINVTRERVWLLQGTVSKTLAPETNARFYLSSLPLTKPMKLDGKMIQESIMQLIQDYKFDPYEVLEIVKMWLRSAYKKDYINSKRHQIAVNIDAEGNIKVYQEYDVVAKDDEVEDEFTQMTVKEAKKIRKDIATWEKLLIDITPEDLQFSRIGVQSAAQTIKQNLKGIERERFFEKFQTKQGEILKAKVLRTNGDTIILDIDGTTVVLDPQGQIPNRMYTPGEEISVLLKQISKGPGGIILDITQSSEDFIEAILRKNIPELEEGKVFIEKIVRMPGKRSKIIVSSTDEKVDPVGVMVGQKGDRIMVILSMLDGEKLDFIEYTEDDLKLIADCLKPAKVNTIEIKGRKAIVTMNEDQKALAIGKGASNIKLATLLCGYHIEIK